MTIKKQFTLLITGIIIVPLLCSILLPLYHYLNSPQRYMLKDFEEIRETRFESMKDDDWAELRKRILAIPANVQAAVFIENTAVMSTIPGIESNSNFGPKELFDFIKNTSEEYDYQFQSPDQRTIRTDETRNRRRPPYTILYRYQIKKVSKNRTLPNRFYYPIFVIFFVFEIFFITVLIIISRIISSSITILEQNTKRIADGDLNVKLEVPQKGIYTNEITTLIDSLARMRDSLKEEEERRVRFIMGISHDLRTPVTLIKGYTEAITDGVVSGTEDINKSLSIIHSKTEQLEAMINELIDYVKLSSQDFRKQLCKENLFNYLTEYSEGILNAGSVFKRQFSTSLDLPHDLYVPMDKNLITRVLENLMSNALRYTKDGDSISFNVCMNSDVNYGKSVRLSIKDSGCGISKEECEHIFDLFYRATNSRREQGMGIGLSVVKSILENHGWFIDVVSEKDKGSEFIITIPVTD